MGGGGVDYRFRILEDNTEKTNHQSTQNLTQFSDQSNVGPPPNARSSLGGPFDHFFSSHIIVDTTFVS